MNWVVLAGSLAVVLVLAAGAWMLRLGRDERIGSPEDAADATEAALAGFRTSGAVVGSDGAGALVVDGAGRVAVCKRHGARLAVREVGWSDIRATSGGLLVESGERRFGQVIVAGVDALDVKRLSSSGAGETPGVLVDPMGPVPGYRSVRATPLHD